MTNPRGETDLCRNRLIKYCEGQGVDLGCGNVKIKPDAIGIDLYHPAADMHEDVRDLSCYPSNHFDFVYSSHMLEELEHTEATLRDWLRIIKPGGYLVLYQADRDLYFPIGNPQCNVAHKHHFKWDDLWKILETIGGVNLVEHGTHPELKEWSFELVVKKKL
jgi:predicted SAM-dependent methyltransferase